MESVSRICVIELACDLCGDWKKLSHVLGLSREVEGISQDYRKNGVCEQAYRMLQAWKQKNGSDATYEVLRKALKRDPLSRVDLAEKYCDGGNQDTLKTDIHSLQGHLKCGEVSSSDLVNIAADLGKEWMWVGRLLGLEDTPLDSIKETHDHPNDWSYQMLLLWKQKNATQATYSWLARALLHRAVGQRVFAEKYCIELQQLADGASYVPHEEKLLQLNDKMEKLRVNLPSKGPAGSPINSSSSAEAKVVTKSETDSAHPPFVPDDCIRKKLITCLPYKVWGDLVVKLNPPRELQMRGDYKDLAGEMGYGVEKILYFKSLSNPAEAVLSSCSPTCSMEKLCNKLEAIGRPDARGLIDEWVKSQDCKCTLCCS